MTSTALLSRAVSTALLLLPATAMAGTLSFTGEIVASTCTVGSGADAMTIPMGKVDASQLASEGALASRRAFSISLKCSGGSKSKVAATFESPSADPVTGNLPLEGKDKATHVQIVLHNQANEQQKFNAPPTSSSWRDATDGDLRLHYTASYIATGGAATPGSAGAVATFTVVYQ